MVRADRLVAALLFLQRRGRVTAAELATELEVSIPTARRDLEALSAAGIPVYPQPGRGGGWSLVGGARTDLSGLTANEARALFTLAGPSASLDPDAKAALRKLVAALPDTFRDGAEAAAGSSVIDARRWGHRRPDVAPLVDRLRDATIRQLRVRLTYTGRDRRSSVRDVDPYGLIDRGAAWYLVAGTDSGRRTFRLDRIGGVDTTDETFARPADFSLDAEWERIVEEVEQRRSEVTATVLTDERHVYGLEQIFGRHCHIDGNVDGLRQLQISAATIEVLAELLAGWGRRIEVTAPEPLRQALRRIGTELLDQYTTSL